jgi:hypothetical protein
MNTKLDRLNCLIRFLIFSEKISYKSTQKDIQKAMNRDSISKALNGDENYLTDNFLKVLKSATIFKLIDIQYIPFTQTDESEQPICKEQQA